MSRPSARAVATRVLHRVLADDAYATVSLDAELSRARLDARDAALASRIVYGALRVFPALEEEIRGALSRPRQKLDAFALAALAGALFQLAHLERVPAYAVVDETVTLVREKRGAGVARFANAVLRKLASRERVTVADPPMALPRWLSRSLERSLGEARARAFVDASGVPALGLRAHVPREALEEELAAERPAAELRESLLVERALLAQNLGDPRTLAAFSSGKLSVQEEGSQLVGELVGATAGERVLDACAGRGGKTALLAEAVGPSGEVVASDLHEPRLDAIAAQFDRLGLKRPAEVHAVDLAVGVGDLRPGFDRVLVDAPCTGLGTVRRRPELLLRVGPDDPARLSRLQRAIVKSAASLVRPGGLLVYAVCSPLAEEGIEVARSLSESLSIEPRAGRELPSGLAFDPDGGLRIGPFSGGPYGGPDAYQVFFLRRAGR